MAQETLRLEYEMAMDSYRREKKQTEELVDRMLGKYLEPPRPLKEARREISKKLGGVRVSRLIIEAR
ncbi:MAG: hypothetical protein HY681_07575 [Chloroflexi bacterium]|nr:hypothetical protein [Chloroflexota bacterium]